MSDSQPRAAVEYVEVPALGDLLVKAHLRFGDRAALTVDGEHRTFSELHDRAATIARALLGAGVVPGSRVGLLMPNCVEFVESVFATAMIGAVVVPINNRFRARELQHVAADAELRAVLTYATVAEPGHYAERALSLLDGLDSSARPVAILLGGGHRNGFVDEASFLAVGAAVTDAELDHVRAGVRLRDVAAILYTSGTTALPKGCVHTHEALVRNGIVTGRSRFLLTEQDRFWDPLPMFHVAFLAPMIACLDAGAHLISMMHFDGEHALEILERERATWVFASFLAIAQGLLDASSFRTRDLSSVRMTMCVGTSAALRRFQAGFPGAQLLSTYGSTETAGVITYHEPDATAEQRITTCGTAFRGVELAIRDLASDERLPAGQPGEILVRGYSVLDGYLNDDAATAAAIDAGRWLHTGDLGLLDGQGHLHFRGRLKDMLKVGGENVSAAEVEAVLTEHPSVIAAQVVGAPDTRLDEVVAAFIELTAGASLDADELIAFCTGKIASYKIPRHVRFVTEWPMSATKVRKEDLRDRIARELAGSLAGRQTR